MTTQKNNTLILVFTRNPELGKVKTRLAKGIGDQAALQVYIRLLQHTEKILSQINADKSVIYSNKIRLNDMWDDEVYQKKVQIGKDLGERMYHAFLEAFNANYQKVIIIGSDLFDLKTQHLENAIEALNKNEIVIGPAKDGGYYLLGMKKLHQDVFKNKNWGTNSVLNATLKDLKSRKIEFLETLNDIDYAQDLEPYEEFKPLIK